MMPKDLEHARPRKKCDGANNISKHHCKKMKYLLFDVARCY